MESIKACNVCFLTFDAKDHAPRFLPCGHSLCSQCLTRIIYIPNLRKCPFDHIPFCNAQMTVASFPLNFIVMDMLKQKNKNLCKTHPGEALQLICLTEKKKICSECAKQKGHQGHRIKNIKELKAEGAKLKGELEQKMLNLKKYELERDKDYDQVRKVFIKTIDDQFKEIEEILVEKQHELVQQTNNLLNLGKQKGSEGSLALKQQMDVMINNIAKTCNDDDDGNLILLDKTINNNSNMASMKPQLLKDKASRVHNKLLEMQKTVSDSLKTYQRRIVSLRLLNQGEVIKESYTMQEEKQQISREEVTKMNKKLRSIKFKTYFDVNIDSGDLNLSASNTKLKEVEINLDDLQATKRVIIRLNRYGTLSKEPNQNGVYSILHSLEKLPELHVYFAPKGFKNDSLVWLGDMLHLRFHDLTTLCLRFEQCKLDVQSMTVLDKSFLSKAIYSKFLGLNFSSCQISDKDIKFFARSFHSFQKTVESLRLTLDNNDITDDGICEIFQMSQSLEKLQALELSFKGTKITDKSLEIFGEGVLPDLINLNYLGFSINESYSNRISEKGIWSVLKNLPNLKTINLDFSSIPITDKVMDEFVGKVLPKLDFLRSFNLTAHKRQIKDANIEKMHELAKLLKPLEVQVQPKDELVGSEGKPQCCS